MAIHAVQNKLKSRQSMTAGFFINTSLCFYLNKISAYHGVSSRYKSLYCLAEFSQETSFAMSR